MPAGLLLRKSQTGPSTLGLISPECPTPPEIHSGLKLLVGKEHRRPSSRFLLDKRRWTRLELYDVFGYATRGSLTHKSRLNGLRAESFIAHANKTQARRNSSINRKQGRSLGNPPVLTR